MRPRYDCFENDEEWKESFLRLSDKTFFSLMRLYLGEVKTPYNKQKLLLQLEGFLRREETQKNIAALLSKKDAAILAAIKFLGEATSKNLQFFFEAEDSQLEKIEQHLQELKTRLLICQSSRYEEGYKILPPLQNALDSVLDEKILFPEYSANAQNKNGKGGVNFTPPRFSKNDFATSELLCSFLSYVFHSKNLCKLDGTFKKKAQEELAQKISQKEKVLSIILRGLLNLRLAKNSESGIELEWNSLEEFAKLSLQDIFLYLCASAACKNSLEKTRLYAEIFCKAVLAIPAGGFEKNVFLKYAFLLCIKKGAEDFSSPSRFSKILQKHDQNLEEQNEDGPKNLKDFFERFLQNAAAMGMVLLQNDEAVFRNDDFFAANFSSKNAGQIFQKGQIKIDGASNITLIKGFELHEILPLAKFAFLCKFDTAALFEISRESFFHAFDEGMTGEKILSFLKERTNAAALPCSLEVSAKEWEASYNSVEIYNGFVAKFDKKTAAFFLANKNFCEHILQKLSDCVFLLDSDCEKNVERLLKKCGIENARKIRSAKKVEVQNDFDSIFYEKDFLKNEKSPSKKSSKNSEKIFAQKTSPKKNPPPHKNAERCAEKTLQELYKKIDALKIAEEKKDALRELASQKLLVSEEQLQTTAISHEKNSARGMDYQGKLHIAEQAVRNKEKILFRLSKNSPLETATPISVEKKKFEDGVYLDLLVAGEKKEYSVGRIEFIQRIKKTQFLE